MTSSFIFSGAVYSFYNLENIDSNTFKPLNETYAVDKNSFYVNGKAVTYPNIDRSSIEVINNFYIHDGNSVFFELPAVFNPDSNESLGLMVLPGVDPKSFRVVDVENPNPSAKGEKYSPHNDSTFGVSNQVVYYRATPITAFKTTDTGEKKLEVKIDTESLKIFLVRGWVSSYWTHEFYPQYKDDVEMDTTKPLGWSGGIRASWRHSFYLQDKNYVYYYLPGSNAYVISSVDSASFKFRLEPLGPDNYDLVPGDVVGDIRDGCRTTGTIRLSRDTNGACRAAR